MAEEPRVHQARVVGTPSGPRSSLDPFAALGQIVDAAREFGKIYQTEHTARARISAYVDTEVTRIKTAEAVLTRYFEKVFEERRVNFQELFSRLDTALEQRDGAAINNIVCGIVDIARSSPLADIGDLSKIRAALDDPDQVWEL